MKEPRCDFCHKISYGPMTMEGNKKKCLTCVERENNEIPEFSMIEEGELKFKQTIVKSQKWVSGRGENKKEFSKLWILIPKELTDPTFIRAGEEYYVYLKRVKNEEPND